MRSAFHRLKTQYSPNPRKVVSFLVRDHNFPIPTNSTYGIGSNFGSGVIVKGAHFSDSAAKNCEISDPNGGGEESAAAVHRLLNSLRFSSVEAIEKSLEECSLNLSDDLVVDVINRHNSDWQPAYTFFNWVSGSGHSVGSTVYNAILDVLGKNRRFDEAAQVLDEMSHRKGLFDEGTHGVLLNRYAAAHMVDEAIDVFDKRGDYGLETDLVAFRTLVMWLCRYKHVEEAETLFYSEKNEFAKRDIKTMNIILNGWCVTGNVREAKRFWKDIIASRSIPDKYTYGTFINALTKKGKLGSAMELFKEMWKKGILDVVICNCMIDALCFKKRIPEALEIFKEMNKVGCLPNASTYNSLIKHFCKIRRMEMVYDLVEEMESKRGICSPNELTYSYLLKSAKKAEEVSVLLERMKSNGCGMTSDLYNLVLKLYMGWDYEDGARNTWLVMERDGFGPDRSSYTIMIHRLYERGRVNDALCYYDEMIARGMLPEPRTEILMNAMDTQLTGRDDKIDEDDNPLMHRQIRKKREG